MSRYQYDRGGSGQRGQAGDPLSPNDPSAVGPTGAPLYSNKFNKQTATRMRIGDPLSPVSPGDYSPTGKVYQRGQYAPTIDELASESLKEATQNNLISGKLPLLDDEGNLDEKKLDSWNPNSDFMNYGTTISSDVPKHSAATILTAFDNMGDWLENLNLKHVFSEVEARNQPKGPFGDIIIQAETNGANRSFTSNLRVYPSFYKYVSLPLKTAGVGRDTGISVANYAVSHAVGHIVFSKLTYDAKLEKIGDFIDASGWEKNGDVNVDSGSYLGYKNPSPWKRSHGSVYPTELSKYSPMDDFSESFALFYTNPDYLRKVSPNRFSSLTDIVDGYGAY